MRVNTLHMQKLISLGSSCRGLTTSPTTPFDVCVIGSGPGGYVAAIKASQLGLKTACVEKSVTLGGTCLNVGCIPSKSLLHNSHLYHMAKSGQLAARGIKCDNVTLDLKAMMAMKDQAVKGLTYGVGILFKSNKISRFHGVASIPVPGAVQIRKADGTVESIQAKNIIVATGSDVMHLPGIKINERNVISSTGALSLAAVPRELMVIGGGVIGLELGSVWSRLGAKVTVVEMTNQVGGTNIDHEVAVHLLKILKKQGVQFRLESKVEAVKEQGNNSIAVKCSSAKGVHGAERVTNCLTHPVPDELSCDVLMVCAGRRAYSESLGLDKIGVQVDKTGRLVVDQTFQTTVPGIFAIGDCVRGPMLAHKAEDEGIMCAEYIVTGSMPHLNFDHVPNVIYTHPEVAWVGKTEEALKSEGVKYNTGKFPMIANSRAKTIGETDGFCKILSDSQSGKLLGAHIINSVAGEMIAEAVVAMDNGLTSEQIAKSCHAHPTWSESFKEANMHSFCGKTINNIN